MDNAERNETAFRRVLVSAERFSAAAIRFGSRHVKTPGFRSSASLCSVTSCDPRLIAFFATIAPWHADRRSLITSIRGGRSSTAARHSGLRPQSFFAEVDLTGRTRLRYRCTPLRYRQQLRVVWFTKINRSLPDGPHLVADIDRAAGSRLGYWSRRPDRRGRCRRARPLGARPLRTPADRP